MKVHLIFLLALWCSNPGGVAGFCYDDPACGPDTWPGLCASGSAQSPINFDGEDTEVKLLHPVFHEFYGHPSTRTESFLIQNTGHSVEVFFPAGGEPVLKGSPNDLPGNYHFVQLHFHWGKTDEEGSEHQLNGKSAALELHLVHHSTKYKDYAEASVAPNDPNAVAIIAILFEVGSEDNLTLEPIIDAIGEVRKYADGVDVNITKVLDMEELFPHPHLDFYRYEGSLTTPDCHENRVWTVFAHPNKLSERQLQAFKGVFDENGVLISENHRPVQPRNGRKITRFNIPATLEEYEELLEKTASDPFLE